MFGISPSSYWCTWKVALEALEELEWHWSIALCDTYSFLVLRNLLHAPFSEQMHANH